MREALPREEIQYAQFTGRGVVEIRLEQIGTYADSALERCYATLRTCWRCLNSSIGGI